MKEILLSLSQSRKFAIYVAVALFLGIVVASGKMSVEAATTQFTLLTGGLMVAIGLDKPKTPFAPPNVSPTTPPPPTPPQETPPPAGVDGE